MIGAAELLILISIFAISAPAIDRALLSRRHAQTETFEGALRRAFPFPPPSPSLETLARRAEEALEQDDFSRGVAAIAATYDHADEGEPAAG